MKLRVCRFGKAALADYRPLCATYIQRLSRLFAVEPVELKIKAEQRQSAEALLQLIFPGKSRSTAKLIILDEHGRSLSSIAFAKHIGDWRDDRRVDQLCFVIGDPYGFPEHFTKHADLLLAASAFTFTSDLCELVLWEQIYRASEILKGSGYHHA